MSRKPRPLAFCLCLSVLLALLGFQSAAACPGEAVVALVGCEGHVVWLDATGAPVSQDCRHCPDCLGGVAAVTPASPRTPAWTPRGAEALSLSRAVLSLPALPPSPAARGPPTA